VDKQNERLIQRSKRPIGDGQQTFYCRLTSVQLNALIAGCARRQTRGTFTQTFSNFGELTGRLSVYRRARPAVVTAVVAPAARRTA
jgi:hypothetical protein